MDQIGLALKLRRLAAWLDGRCQPDNLIRKQLHCPPFGDCYVTIDPDRQGPLASFNQNRVYLCGAEAGMGLDSVGGLIELFRAEGVRRFFVWLSPGPDMDAMRGWLEAARRIAQAEQLGCAMLVSETLYMLEHSFRNLQRAGFQETYEKEVYEWNA
jgi:hypothetical protein